MEGRGAGGFAERDARGSEYPKYDPVWDFGSPEEYLAAKAAEEEAERAEEEGEPGRDPLEPLVEGIRLSAIDGTQVVAVTRYERDEGSTNPRARAKRTYYWVKEKVLWLIGVVAASAIATLIWQMIG